ncbi:MAG: 6-hydroxymethylpterin diphosphokinase MptE-like protein [Treponema sp.]
MQHYSTDAEEPQLIETGRGFSVFYREKYLYSKYDPQRSLVTQIANLHIPSYSLILCLSPLLGYGLAELYAKLPEYAYILAVERDRGLMQFSLQHLTEKPKELLAQKKITYINSDSIASILSCIGKLPLFPFKKCIAVQCSGGTTLYCEFYAAVQKYVDDFISRFWINRLTLIQLGRNYARNIFRNLTAAVTNESWHILQGSEEIHKPILVAGAGPSLDETRNFIRKYRSKFFLLAVDAAAPALLPEIVPDALILIESQYWIDSAFIGLKKSGIPIFADITASPRAVKASDSMVYFFCTEYAPAHYLQEMYRLLHPLILPPLGSVGLTALELALRLTNASLPILHTGLDFSWGKGLTHARNSSPIKKLRMTDAKLSPLYTTAYPVGVQHIIGKNHQELVTLPNLMNYAEIYRHCFAQNTRIIDIGTSGCNLSDRTITLDDAAKLLQSVDIPASCIPFTGCQQNTHTVKAAIGIYLNQTKQQLLAVNSHLCNSILISQPEFESAITEMDYLYLHFPDAAWGCRFESSFLKRMRLEIAHFLPLFTSTRIHI